MKIIRKTFSVETKTIDDVAGIYEAMITTENLDRQGDMVHADGAKLENYLKNPVVLWGHDYGEPAIAKAISIEVIPGTGIRSQFQFPEKGIHPKADIVRGLWASGFLNAVSIGFQPLKSAPIDAKEPWGSQDYQEWELLEYSIVNVPAQQSALRLSIADAMDEISKSGRVLSKANENRIRDAQRILDDVLTQLEKQPESDDPDKSATAQTNSDDDDEQRNKAEEEREIAEAVLNYLTLVKEILK